MEFEVRGEWQEVKRIEGQDSILHDPLLVTVLDFNRRALDQLAHALHLAVKSTYNHAPGINKSNFFKGEDNKSVNPSQDKAGRDVYYLLKHIESYPDVYAEQLDQEEETVEQTVIFLREDIRNRMAHQSYLGCTGESPTGCELKKNQTTMKCLKECKRLLTWIVNAPFYARIAEKVQKILDNIDNMTTVFEDFKRVKQSIKARSENPDIATDTDKAKERLQNLLEALEQEENEASSIEDRPLTHFVNMVMGPRLKELRD